MSKQAQISRLSLEEGAKLAPDFAHKLVEETFERLFTKAMSEPRLKAIAMKALEGNITA